MKKNRAHSTILHIVPYDVSLRENINEFHIEIIKRRLSDYGLDKGQKLAIISLIVNSLKTREVR